MRYLVVWLDLPLACPDTHQVGTLLTNSLNEVWAASRNPQSKTYRYTADGIEEIQVVPHSFREEPRMHK